MPEAVEGNWGEGLGDAVGLLMATILSLDPRRPSPVTRLCHGDLTGGALDSTPRMSRMDNEDLKRALRSVFDHQVLNHGDYNLVYGQPSGSGAAHVIGYRRRPLELVLCPVDVTEAVLADEAVLAEAAGSDSSEAEVASRRTVALGVVGLHNVATLADTGMGYQVETVTGFRTWFEVSPTPAVPLAVVRGEQDAGYALLDQQEDAEDFHRFMGDFMDTLDSYYADPQG